MTKRKKKVTARDYPRHFYPEPRIDIGRALREKGLASAMIDTSDGLSTDLAHLCEESSVGAEVDASRIPRARVGKAERQVDLDLALHGGEDYELLFTVRPGKRVPKQIGGVPLTEIGRIIRSRKISFRTSPIRFTNSSLAGGSTSEVRATTVLPTVYGYLRHQSVSTIKRKSGLR